MVSDVGGCISPSREGTWLFWLPAIALGLRFDSAVGLVLLLVGLAVPGVAGIAFVYLVYDERGRSDFWNRVVNPRRVGLRWLVVIQAVPQVSAFSPASRISSLGGAGLAWGEGVTEFGVNPSLSSRRCSSRPCRRSSKSWGGEDTRLTGCN